MTSLATTRHATRRKPRRTHSLLVLGLLLALGLTLPAVAAQAARNAAPAAAKPQADGYQLPPKPLQAIVDAPRPPQMFLSPRRDRVALVQTPSLPGIAVVAQPE